MTLVLSIPLIMLGGSIGAIGRYLVLNSVAAWTRLPGWCGVMVVNVIGSFLIGFFVNWISKDLAALHPGGQSLMALEVEKLELQELLALSAIGFCGAFTTISSFSLDNYFLACESRGRLCTNVLGSLLICFLAVYLGWLLGSEVAS
ncbi:MAG: CrcB family protein [Planctomycetota bacterium]|nr:CrcB family protein [Planctomycetota bacterium]